MQILNFIFFEEKKERSVSWMISSIPIKDTEDMIRIYYKSSLESSSGELRLKSMIEDVYNDHLNFIEEKIYSPRTILLYGENSNYGHIPNINSHMHINRINIEDIIKDFVFSEKELEEIKIQKEKNIILKAKFKNFLKEYKKNKSN